MINLENLKTKLEQERGRFNRVRSEKEKTELKITELKNRQENIEKATSIIQIVAQRTQQQLEYFISDIITLALESIFDNPYQFKTEFVMKRGKTECELWFERNEQKVKPLDASGGGAIDVASFGLRISLWALKKNRPIIILDEPFKHLSKNLHPKATQMLNEISEKLDIQIIVVSHSEDLIEGADKVFLVGMENGISYVKSNFYKSN